MDDLKKHFQKLEADMQVEPFDEGGLWQRIQAGQKPHRPKRVVMMAMRFAAAACILLLIGVGIKQWISSDDKQNKNTLTANNGKEVIKHTAPVNHTSKQETKLLTAKEPEEKNVQPPLRTRVVKKGAPVGDGYPQLIHYQLNRLRHTPVYVETPEFFKAFGQQLQQMDADEADLKKDIQTYGFNDQLAEALITIYQKKLSLLKSLQGEIHKMNAAAKKRQTVAETQPYYLNL